MKTIEQIEKEEIVNLRFSNKEVLKDDLEQAKRSFNLMRAQSLGNLLRSKSLITFEDASGKVFQVNTTVWAVGDKFVTLKCNRHIPINSILEVVF